MKRVRVTRDAKRDVDEIWLFVARDSVDAANRLIDEIAHRFLLIGSSPEMGRIRDNLKPGLRSHPVDNYVIYYRETRPHISIVRVVHGARDIKRLFNV
jgi:toxin ParE1/3/4